MRADREPLTVHTPQERLRAAMRAEDRSSRFAAPGEHRQASSGSPARARTPNRFSAPHVARMHANAHDFSPVEAFERGCNDRGDIGVPQDSSSRASTSRAIARQKLQAAPHRSHRPEPARNRRRGAQRFVESSQAIPARADSRRRRRVRPGPPRQRDANIRRVERSRSDMTAQQLLRIGEQRRMTALHPVDDRFALVWRVELQDGRRGRSRQRADDRRRGMRRFLLEHAAHARRRKSCSGLRRAFDARRARRSRCTSAATGGTASRAHATSPTAKINAGASGTIAP